MVHNKNAHGSGSLISKRRLKVIVAPLSHLEAAQSLQPLHVLHRHRFGNIDIGSIVAIGHSADSTSGSASVSQEAKIWHAISHATSAGTTGQHERNQSSCRGTANACQGHELGDAHAVKGSKEHNSQTFLSDFTWRCWGGLNTITQGQEA